MPIGLKNKSEAQSYLDKFINALKKFSEDDRAHIVVDVPLFHEKQEDFVKEIKSKYETVMSLTKDLAGA